MAREQIKEQLQLNLPGIVEAKVNEVAEAQSSDIAARLVTVVEGVAQKSVPRIVREKLPELAENHLNQAAHTVLPPVIESLTSKALDELSTAIIDPKIDLARKRLQRVNLFILILIVILTLACIGVFLASYFLTQAAPITGKPV
jgi:hypothetical protein